MTIKAKCDGKSTISKQGYKKGLHIRCREYPLPQFSIRSTYVYEIWLKISGTTPPVSLEEADSQKNENQETLG